MSVLLQNTLMCILMIIINNIGLLKFNNKFKIIRA